MNIRTLTWFVYAAALTLTMCGYSAGNALTTKSADDTVHAYLVEIGKSPTNDVIKQHLNEFNTIRDQVTDHELAYVFLSQAYARLFNLPVITFNNYPDFFKFIDVNELWKDADNPDNLYVWAKAGPTAVPVLKLKASQQSTGRSPHWTTFRAQGKVDENGHFGEGWSYGVNGFVHAEKPLRPPEEPPVKPVEEPTSFAWDHVDFKEFYWPSVSDGTGGSKDEYCSQHYEKTGDHLELLGCHATTEAEGMALVTAGYKRAKPAAADLPTCPLEEVCPAEVKAFEKEKTEEAEKEGWLSTVIGWTPFGGEGFSVEFPTLKFWHDHREFSEPFFTSKALGDPNAKLLQPTAMDQYASTIVDKNGNDVLQAAITKFTFNSEDIKTLTEQEKNSFLQELASLFSNQGDEAFETTFYSGDNKIFAVTTKGNNTSDAEELVKHFQGSFQLGHDSQAGLLPHGPIVKTEEPVSFAWDQVDFKEFYWPSVSDGTGGSKDEFCSQRYEKTGKHLELFGCHATTQAEGMALVKAGYKRAKPAAADLPTCPLEEVCPAEVKTFEEEKNEEAKKEGWLSNEVIWTPFHESGYSIEFPTAEVNHQQNVPSTLNQGLVIPANGDSHMSTIINENKEELNTVLFIMSYVPEEIAKLSPEQKSEYLQWLYNDISKQKPRLPTDFVEFKLYSGGDKVYIIEAFGTKTSKNQELAKHFIDSFKLYGDIDSVKLPGDPDLFPRGPVEAPHTN